MTVSNELIDSLLADYKKPEDLIGEHGLLKQLTRKLVERALEAEMAEHLFEKLGINKRDAKDLVELFFEEIKGALESGEQVKLSGFGNFDLRDKNERPGRNPKTGEDIPIKARRVVTFRPGQKLKSRVENSEPVDQ